ncbi:hypothetical protein ACP4OV_002210 [Aristida adscensionis]
MTEVLKSILTQVTKGVQSAGAQAATEQQLVRDICNFLRDKRYLVIIDDIWNWDKWEIIRGALPSNHPSNKIIATTRVNALAIRFTEVAVMHKHWGIQIGFRDWMLSKVISEKPAYDKLDYAVLEKVHRGIVEMCKGMPLGIICLSKALANYKGWDTWKRQVVDGFLRIPSLKPLVESFCLGYDDLPIHVKTCLLYCAIYPEGVSISRSSLVRQWITQGFVYHEGAAVAYLDELVSRNLLLETAARSIVQVHPLMLAFFVCKSREANLVTNVPSSSKIVKSIQRLSCNSSTQYYLGEKLVDVMKHPVMDIQVYHTRSVYFWGSIEPYLKQFGRLRVLQLEHSAILRDDDLVPICGLLHLRYLGLSWCPHISKLPSQIRRLQNLETLDVTGTRVRELPCQAARLPNLVRVLHEVTVVNLPEDLHQVFKNRGTDLEAKCRSIVLLLLDHFRRPSKPLPVSLAGRHVHVPQWIGASLHDVVSLDIMLCKLEEGDQKLLGELPNLECLVVRFQLLPRKAIPIMAGGFKKLMFFCFDSRLPRVAFQPGAMPNLEHLEFKFYSGPASNDPVGITHLPSIENVFFKCSENYSSDAPGIRATIDVVRREAAEHPNKITLWVNDDKPQVFPKKDVAKSRDSTQSATVSGTGVIETSLAENDNIDNKGKAIDVSTHASCSRTRETHEIEETQE